MKKKKIFVVSLILIPIMFVMVILASCGKTNLSNNSNEHNSTIKTEYIKAKGFSHWNNNEINNVDDKLITHYFSDEVDVTNSKQYDLNTGIDVIEDGYVINWYKDKDFKDNLVTQRDYLKYGDNVYFATITTSSGQFVSAYAVNVYVYHDYTYTYYEYQPGYKLASKMREYDTQKVSESKTYKALEAPKNGYTFKGWVTSDNNPFDFSKPIGLTGDLNLYATYEDVELNIDGDKITYSPYLTTTFPIKESTEGHFFDGYYSNGVQYFDENGNAIFPLPFKDTKTIEYGYSEYTQDKYFTFSKVDGGYSVSLKEMPLYTTIISIPKEYNNEPIIAVDENAFKNFNKITKIIIPNSVTSIGDSAFRNCSSLERIEIPTSVTSIGEYAFSGCSSLENITIPNSVITFKKGAFANCSNLTKITIPFVGETLNGSSNTYFGYIFGASSYDYNSNCVPTTLKEVIITGGNSIGKYAFYFCSSLERIVIPNSVTSIGEYAFDWCFSLVIYCEASNQPSGWNSNWNSDNRPVYWGINENNYKEENEFQYVIKDGEAILTRYFGNETTIEIPNTIQINGTTYVVTSIGYKAFYNCDSLEKIVIPNSVTSIGSSAFSLCSSLKSIVIPNSVTTIGDYAFDWCSSFVIYCESSNQPSGWNSNWNPDNRPVYWEINENTYKEENGLRYVIQDGEAILTKYVGNEVSIEIPNTIQINGTTYDVTSIGDSAFKDCKSLESIIIPTSVTSIGSSAFWWCNSLESITIPFVGATLNGSSNTHFGYIFGASSDYENSDYVPTTLKEVIITGGSSIGSSAFSGCSSLESITIPNSVTSIGEYAFSGCSSLENITIPNSVITFKKGAFANCSNLTKITIPFVGETLNGSSNTYFGYIFGASSYGENSKYVPSTLKEVIITGGYSIGEDAFYKCSSLTTVTIDKDSQLQSIGEDAFNNCSSLESIEIPNSVTSIGRCAFEYCSSLKSIEIPNSVTSIGEYAFYNCSSLTTVTVDKDSQLQSIGDDAFEYCSSLESIEIPNSVKGIGSWAFSNCSSLIIYCEANSQPSSWNIEWNHSNIPVYWGINENNYKEENGFQYVIQNGNVILTNYVGNETTIEIPNTIQINGTTYNVTSIGKYAFRNCSLLESIEIPNNVTSIGESAFYGCSSLQSITIPFVGATLNGSSNIQFDYIFGGNKEVPTTLKEIIITGGYSIGYHAFYNCSSLESIVIPASVTSIGNRAFEDCSLLTTVTIDKDSELQSIGDDAFYKCSSLESIVIPTSVTNIGNYAFCGCSSLESIVIPTSVTSIGSWAFSNCGSLIIYCEAGSKPSGWNYQWDYYYNGPVYWKGQWHYDENGNPVRNN